MGLLGILQGQIFDWSHLTDYEYKDFHIIIDEKGCMQDFPHFD